MGKKIDTLLTQNLEMIRLILVFAFNFYTRASVIIPKTMAKKLRRAKSYPSYAAAQLSRVLPYSGGRLATRNGSDVSANVLIAPAPRLGIEPAS